jgi:hypothetical protein
MKITQVGPSAPAARGRKSEKAGDASAGDAFRNHLSDSDGAVSKTTAGATPLAALSSLLAVQEAPEPTSPKKRAIQHGDALLDELKELQVGLVEGCVGEDTLRGLAHMLDQPRPEIDDPELNRVLDDIELRAAVELAKFERSSS